MPQKFELIAAAFTAFRPEGSLDPHRIPAQIAQLRRDGVDGAFICGTTGEGASLTSAERRAVAEAWVNAAPPDFRIIVHVGHASAQEARELAAHAARVGAHAVAAVAPYFLKPRDAQEVTRSIALVAEGAPSLPFYYYHVPVITGIDVAAAAVVREAAGRIPNFRGVKFTDGDLGDLGRVIDLCGDTLEVFYGRDDFLLPALSLGVRRAVGMSYNFTGPLARALVNAFDQGDLPAARRAQTPIREVIAASLPYGIVNALKAASAALGMDCGPVRAPLTTLTQAQAAAILRAAGIDPAVGQDAPRRAA